MPILKCPQCGAKGEICESNKAFAVYGQWPDGHWPVRMCRTCSSGLIVKPRLIPPGAKAVLIPDMVWHRMREAWDAAFPDSVVHGGRDCEPLRSYALEAEKAAKSSLQPGGVHRRRRGSQRARCGRVLGGDKQAVLIVPWEQPDLVARFEPTDWSRSPSRGPLASGLEFLAFPFKDGTGRRINERIPPEEVQRAYSRMVDLYHATTF